jgi:trimeric autotransporter adhesin
MPSIGMRGRMANNRIRGTVSYTLGGSMLNAAPYSITGKSTAEPGSLQQRIAASLGGPLKVPGWFDWSKRANFFVNYSGNHSANPYDAYSTVPTEAMRAGDFSALSTPVIDPLTGSAFANNTIPLGRMDATALALLRYIPLPTLDTDSKNYYRSTTSSTNSDDINIRFMRSFGKTQQRQGPPMGGGPGGPGGPGGGPGLRGGASLSVGLHYTHSTSDSNRAYPTVGGSSKRSGWDIPVNVGFSKWGLMNAIRFQFNQNHSSTANLYAYSNNIAGDLGISGVSSDGFDWGLPNLSFSSITSLTDLTPSSRTDQTITFGDTMTKLKGRHTLRWGVDGRVMKTDTLSNTNPRGTFVFTGIYTEGDTSSSAAATGLDVADFLLGLTQQATVQYGPGKEKFRSWAWNTFFQDDWRVTGSLTINAGVRYEYLSPYWESNNDLVTLDVTSDFTSAVAVKAGATGPYSGTFSRTIVKPDRDNIAPRVGFAWKPERHTTVRGGYGINYSSPTYATIAKNLASQPPFATTDTRTGTLSSPVSIKTAFASASTTETNNNFAVDPNYELGCVQIWNLDVQRSIGRTLTAAVGYTGTRGSSLDLQRAPNRSADGTLTIDGVVPFIWESSGGASYMHALNVRLRKRPSKGIGGGLTYTFSKSMDNASTIGGGTVIVAQNDKDLDAEWGLSSFDQRHRLSADFSVQLPFGPNQHWLNNDGTWAKVLGNWAWAGSLTLATGNPSTARVVGATTSVAQGTNGTLRANYNGETITLKNPTIAEYFNTAAFSVPATGQFGNAGRNTIIGPGTASMNMSLMKSVTFASSRSLSVRVEANNVFNHPQFGSIDSAVNSLTFGQVVSMKSMRTVQIVARAGF